MGAELWMGLGEVCIPRHPSLCPDQASVQEEGQSATSWGEMGTFTKRAWSDEVQCLSFLKRKRIFPHWPNTVPEGSEGRQTLI